MSTRSFSSLFMVASCAGAALGCYLVSLHVASERAQLEQVETKIVLAQRDLRVIQTEIGTRGRLSQLERWNAGAFALSAPAADQFLRGGFELARLAQPEHKVEFQAPVVLASAPAPESPRAPVGEPSTDESGAPEVTGAPKALLHVASLKTITPSQNPGTREVPALPRSLDKPGLAAAKSPAQKAAAKPIAKPAVVASKSTDKKSVDKPALASAKQMTKPVRLAKTDPLAPLAAKHVAHSRENSADR